jgi:demethylmenaquinone methyltransferase/2-methoxy-6-polyprenyl-1,4-benzoquinol methylase
MLEVGRERAAARGLDGVVTFEQGNAEELAYPDRNFDCVTIAFGIRNVPRIEQALDEAYRVLKIGGTVSVPRIFLGRRARDRYLI